MKINIYYIYRRIIKTKTQGKMKLEKFIDVIYAAIPFQNFSHVISLISFYS